MMSFAAWMKVFSADSRGGSAIFWSQGYEAITEPLGHLTDKSMT